MNKDILEGKWKQFRGTIKEKWGKLTDDELDQAQGNYEKLSGLIQEKYGYAKDRAEQELDRVLIGDGGKMGAEPAERKVGR
ncbi:MAG: CsbD family protein [Candidatus Rokubacteria bacterium]|nr:CsbD family protein [Candidatus Rokubacteria bacterium]